MTREQPASRHSPEALVTVSVTDTVTPALAGHGGIEYQSAPQTRAEALALVRVLLGRPEDPGTGDGPWTRPIAGGRRIITIDRRADLEDR